MWRSRVCDSVFWVCGFTLVLVVCYISLCLVLGFTLLLFEFWFLWSSMWCLSVLGSRVSVSQRPPSAVFAVLCLFCCVFSCILACVVTWIQFTCARWTQQRSCPLTALLCRYSRVFLWVLVIVSFRCFSACIANLNVVSVWLWVLFL